MVSSSCPQFRWLRVQFLPEVQYSYSGKKAFDIKIHVLIFLVIDIYIPVFLISNLLVSRIEGGEGGGGERERTLREYVYLVCKQTRGTCLRTKKLF